MNIKHKANTTQANFRPGGGKEMNSIGDDSAEDIISIPDEDALNKTGQNGIV